MSAPDFVLIPQRLSVCNLFNKFVWAHNVADKIQLIFFMICLMKILKSVRMSAEIIISNKSKIKTIYLHWKNLSSNQQNAFWELNIFTFNTTLFRNFHQAYKKKSNWMISSTLCDQTNLLKRLETDHLCGIKTKSGADKNIRKILLKYKNSVVLTNYFLFPVAFSFFL